MNRLENNIRKIPHLTILILGLTLVFHPHKLYSLKEARIIKEILIKVQPEIIAMPGNMAIVRAPLSTCRVRSTPLRNLNKKYNAISIERLFEVKYETREKSEVPKSFVSKEKEKADQEPVDLSKIFTKATKDELMDLGKFSKEEIGQAEDIYLIQFEFSAEDEVNMKIIISDYEELPVVTFAKFVTRGN